jgi:hypothetical protein
MSNKGTKGAVTPEQLDACWRVFAGQTGEPFYRVRSRTSPNLDYTVRAIKVGRKYYITCTCPTGQNGGNCWHKRAAKAHAKEYKELTRARIVDRFPFPNSSTVSWTVQEGLAQFQVMQYNTGYVCDCYQYTMESGPYAPQGPCKATCRHIEAVIVERGRIEEELQRYNRETVVA